MISREYLVILWFFCDVNYLFLSLDLIVVWKMYETRGGT